MAKCPSRSSGIRDGIAEGSQNCDTKNLRWYKCNPLYKHHGILSSLWFLPVLTLIFSPEMKSWLQSNAYLCNKVSKPSFSPLKLKLIFEFKKQMNHQVSDSSCVACGTPVLCDALKKVSVSDRSLCHMLPPLPSHEWFIAADRLLVGPGVMGPI